MFIYVASPYSSPDREVEISRYEKVMEFMTERVNEKPSEVLYSPILHCHDWAERFTLSKDAAWWRRHNLSILQRASGLFLLTLPGWQESKGVKVEIDFAIDLYLPITVWKWNEGLELYHGFPYPQS